MAPPLNAYNTGPLYASGASTIRVGGRQWPGLITVTEAGWEIKHDKSDKAGKHGGKSVKHGAKNNEISWSVRVWTQEQFLQLSTIISDELKIAKISKSPREVDNYIMSLFGISWVVITSISKPRLTAKDLTIDVKGTKWSPEDARSATKSVKNAALPLDIIELRAFDRRDQAALQSLPRSEQQSNAAARGVPAKPSRAKGAKGP